MKNQLTKINILSLLPNAIAKIFILIEDKYLLRLREVCHAAKDEVDASILNKDVDNVHLVFSTYFDVLGYKSYTFLRIAMTKIRAELPIITIKAHEDRFFELRFSLKLEDFSTFLDLLGPRIAGVQWRGFCLYSAPIAVIRTLAQFFNGKHVYSIHTLVVKSADYATWLTLIRNVTASKFSCHLSVVTNDDYKFLLELSENVYCASINDLEIEIDISLLSIVKAMFSRKCVQLILDYSFFTLSDVESLLAFVHRSKKKIYLNDFTHVNPLDVNIGAYYVFVYEWSPPSPEGERSLVIAPIESRED